MQPKELEAAIKQDGYQVIEGKQFKFTCLADAVDMVERLKEKQIADNGCNHVKSA